MNNPPGVEIHLDRESPSSVTFGVSVSKLLLFLLNKTKLNSQCHLLIQFYKKSWEEDFAFNSGLNVGEAPEWHPYDMIDEGGVNLLLNEIRNFLEILQNKLLNTTRPGGNINF